MLRLWWVAVSKHAQRFLKHFFDQHQFLLIVFQVQELRRKFLHPSHACLIDVGTTASHFGGHRDRGSSVQDKKQFEDRWALFRILRAVHQYLAEIFEGLYRDFQVSGKRSCSCLLD